MWNDDYGGKGEAAGEGGGAIKNLPFKRGRREKGEKYQFDSNPAIFLSSPPHSPGLQFSSSCFGMERNVGKTEWRRNPLKLEKKKLKVALLTWTIRQQGSKRGIWDKRKKEPPSCVYLPSSLIQSQHTKNPPY